MPSAQFVSGVRFSGRDFDRQEERGCLGGPLKMSSSDILSHSVDIGDDRFPYIMSIPDVDSIQDVRIDLPSFLIDETV